MKRITWDMVLTDDVQDDNMLLQEIANDLTFLTKKYLSRLGVLSSGWGATDALDVEVEEVEETEADEPAEPITTPMEEAFLAGFNEAREEGPDGA